MRGRPWSVFDLISFLGSKIACAIQYDIENSHVVFTYDITLLLEKVFFNGYATVHCLKNVVRIVANID